ncbi:hypothetical protein E2K98_14140 [Bacillus salipaludis]|uniref:Uncharacterized protein n=1 Tax=Bacillus salipaludis TaxID=2547811 RepID=A0A4R5VSP8_9BACI|nr:hypothetical protein [Bacillus salipaludis]MDQ6598590.1 hypothetical protein [Bacillus salipaludis]TDK60860.1 hypothetical protein E2K98_14140 [Bacillus salipaludis]
MKNICIAIPVHENRDVIIQLLENIKYFCPNSSVVLFQSGQDPNLCKNLGVPICPTSFPLTWGQDLSWFLLNVMEWLEKIQYPYDYLVNLDSDALFVKKGFEEFVIAEMQGVDYMAARFSEPEDWWQPGQTMMKVWPLWQPIFNRNHFLAGFMGGQVFSKNYVKAIMDFDKLDEIKKLMKQHEKDIFALEEMLFATLTHTLGMKAKRYPKDIDLWNRAYPQITLEEVESIMSSNEETYFIHPVYRDINNPVRKYVKTLQI